MSDIESARIAENDRGPWDPAGPNADLYWHRAYLVQKAENLRLLQDRECHLRVFHACPKCGHIDGEAS